MSGAGDGGGGAGGTVSQSRSRSQWLFSPEELKRSPSSQAGHPYERERLERMKGCDFILKVGMKLRLPQTTISTACVFLHRFYMRFTLKEYHYYEIAATTIFLATKCEETGRKLADIVVACAKTAQKNDAAIVDEQSKEYWAWRDVILYNEELLLEALCFDLIIDHPYSQLKEYWRRFNGEKAVAKTAWACANDTYRTTIHLCYDTDTIAVACLYYASIFSRQILDDVAGRPWYESIEVDLHSVSRVIQTMVELYEGGQQVVKDGNDPKALAVAGTEALRLLEEQMGTIEGNEEGPLAGLATSEDDGKVDTTTTTTTSITLSSSHGKRLNAADDGTEGRDVKRTRVGGVDSEHTSPPAEGSVKT